MHRFIFTFIAIWALTVASRADVAPNPMFSKGIEAFNETQVQMVDEVVTVDMYKDYALVTAEFNMKNHGRKTKLEVGFPNIVGNFISSLTNFTVTVDGDERPYTVRANNDVKEYPPGEKPVDWDPEAKTKWLLWDETFRKGKSKKIVVRYKQPRGLAYNGGLLGSGSFHYILETGAGWYKGIEHATVIVNLKDGLTTNHIFIASPSENRIISDESIRWEFRNLEPTMEDNIFVSYKDFKDYDEFLEYHKDRKISDWREAWAFAYACNKAGQYDLAVKTIQPHVLLPEDVQESNRPILKSDPELMKWIRDNDEKENREKKYRQMALDKQLVIARYQLYLNDRNEKSEKDLLVALSNLKAWAQWNAENPEIYDRLIPDGDYEAPSHQWLFSDFIMDDYSIASWKRGVSTFGSRWEAKVEAAIQGKSNVRLVEQHVSIDFYKDRRDVTAEYSFKNTGPSTTVTIELKDLAGDFLMSDLFTDFHLYINDTAVPIDSSPTPPTDDGWNRSRWNPVWDVSFGEMENKKIRVTYSVPYDLKRAQSIGGLLDGRYYDYRYGRSASWNDKIEHASIIIELKDISTQNLDIILPPRPSTKTENRLIWEYKDWEPSSRGSIEFYYNNYKDYAEYVDKHKEKGMADWRDAWRMAYACNKAGMYKEAINYAKQGIAMPYEGIAEDELAVRRSPEYKPDPQFPHYKQIVLYNQWAMAAYQLYLQDKSRKNKQNLKEAINGMKTWTAKVVSDPQDVDWIFPNEDFSHTDYQWLVNKYLTEDDNSTYGDLVLGLFKLYWLDHVEQILEAHEKTKH